MTGWDSVFIITLSKKKCPRDLLIGLKDASRDSLQSALTIRQWSNFLMKLWHFRARHNRKVMITFPPVAKSQIAFDHVFFDLFSIIAFWEARKTRRVILHVILYNLREKSADDLIFWWSYGNFSPVVLTLLLRRVLWKLDCMLPASEFSVLNSKICDYYALCF